MIRYALACDQAHEFESWFASSDAYETLRRQGLAACPVCGSGKVEKRIMAPRVARTDLASAPPSPAAEAPRPEAARDEAVGQEAPLPVALLSERERAVRAMIRAVREHVVRTADDVGAAFPDEARRMHDGEIEHRPIYGEASPAEARALVEDGIPIQPLPVLPDERN